MKTTMPLSQTQSIIYQIIHYAGSVPGLNVPVCLRIKGPINTASFARAAASMAARHPILSSRLELRHGSPVQFYCESAQSFSVIDSIGTTDPDSDRILSTLADAPFDVFSENPFRIFLAQRDDNDAFLLFVGHHLFLDRPAVHSLVEDYLSMALGETGPADDAWWDNGDRSFLAYVSKEQSMIEGGALAQRQKYWLEYLRLGDPRLYFSDRKTEPTVQPKDSIPFALKDDSYRAFNERARALRVTNFSLAASAIFHSIREVTGQDSVTLTAAANTRIPPFERTVGNFMGTIYLNNRAENAVGTSDDAVRRVFKEVLAGFRNYLPATYFTEHVEWLRERAAKGFPMMSMTDALVNYLPMPDESAGPTSHEITSFPLTARGPQSEANYSGQALIITMWPTLHALNGTVEYASEVVDAKTAQTFTSSLTSAMRRT